LLEAAGGGGGVARTGYPGGAGGGLTGSDGVGLPGGTGGTQTAGGHNPAIGTFTCPGCDGGSGFGRPGDLSGGGGSPYIEGPGVSTPALCPAAMGPKAGHCPRTPMIRLISPGSEPAAPVVSMEETAWPW
jgi:hypothetical protein